jgi:hypothetical protein
MLVRVGSSDRLCRAKLEGSAVEVADSTPKLDPRGARLRRQAASFLCGWPRTKESQRPGWLDPARSWPTEVEPSRAKPEPEESEARCLA